METIITEEDELSHDATETADATEGATKPRKGERTRERILESALTLFAKKGYQATTMREIAATADCSLGLAYRYFSSKDEMVLALYERLASELSEEVERLPKTNLATRWAAVERADLSRMSPHRESLAALYGAGLAPDAPTQVLGGTTAPVREQVRGAFARMIAGSTDRISERQAAELTTLFYATHLSLVLFWLQDRTPNQRATQELIDLGRELLNLMRPTLRVPMISGYLTRLAGIFTPLFGPVLQHSLTQTEATKAISD